MTPSEQLRQRANAWRRLSTTVMDWQVTVPRKRECQERSAVNDTVLDAEALAELCSRLAHWLEAW